MQNAYGYLMIRALLSAILTIFCATNVSAQPAAPNPVTLYCLNEAGSEYLKAEVDVANKTLTYTKLFLSRFGATPNTGSASLVNIIEKYYYFQTSINDEAQQWTYSISQDAQRIVVADTIMQPSEFNFSVDIEYQTYACQLVPFD